MHISMEVRWAYVWQHFRQAYEGVPAAYADVQARLHVADAAGRFFAETRPYPPEPAWREWQGQWIPFFFGPAPEQPLLELLPNGHAHVHADLVSAAFYLLSGWQEYHSAERDRHGRFPYAASVQCRYGFVAVPVVNYYFDVLKTAVEHATGQTLLPRRWADGAPFATFVTHDVDSLYSAWKAPAKAAWQRRQWLEFGKQIWYHLTQRDAWNNLEHVQRVVTRHGAISTFFVLPRHHRAPNGTPNADYRLAFAWPDIQRLKRRGAELALHGSIGTATSLAQLQHEKTQLREAVAGNRFHYLSWDPRLTPNVLNQAGFSYDSTLGFAEHYGFRNSYCLPFYPFDFQQNKAYPFLEIPLNVMDATLHHPHYLQLAPHEILPALTPMFQEIERFGGVCTLLWHNDHFDPANTTTGPRQFAELMHYLRARNTAFVNGQDIVLEVRNER